MTKSRYEHSLSCLETRGTIGGVTVPWLPEHRSTNRRAAREGARPTGSHPAASFLAFDAGECASGRTKRFGRFCDARGHRQLGLSAPRPRVVHPLVDAAAVGRSAGRAGDEVLLDGVGERVLHVGVDVHLHDAVCTRGPDVFSGRAAAAVEDEVEATPVAEALGNRMLQLAEQLGPQAYVAGRVVAVDVAEGRGQQVAAALAGAECLGDLERVGAGRV